VKKNLIVILGPTAIGKTNVAVKVAQHFQTEIISADSRQFYKELEIGTVKPGKEELKKVTHHLVNSISIKDSYDVGQFETDALFILDKIFTSHDAAVMVGGSGLFVNAVCDGLDQLPESNPALRNELKMLSVEKGIIALREKLSELDPEYYAAVDRSNPHRLIRAIEICLLTGMKYSELRKKEKKERNFSIIKIGLDDSREKIYQRINERVEAMIKEGLPDEAKKFYDERHLNALQTIGYKELFDYFEKKISLEEAVELIKRNTRRYAKRQLTWFKKDGEIKWFRPEELDEIIKFIEERIKLSD
jgi:tRNA dimethylallyltransferase